MNIYFLKLYWKDLLVQLELDYKKDSSDELMRILFEKEDVDVPFLCIIEDYLDDIELVDDINLVITERNIKNFKSMLSDMYIEYSEAYSKFFQLPL